MAKKTQKEKALGYVLQCMLEIVANLQRTFEPAEVTANADAMLKLSKAYANIEKADPSTQCEQIKQLVKLAGGYADGGII